MNTLAAVIIVSAAWSQPAPFAQLSPDTLKPHCPKGSEPQATPGEQFRYRCVPSKPPDQADPDLAPVLIAPDKPKAKPRSAAPASSFSAPSDYLRYTIKDQVQFEYPKDWHMINGWTDEVPTLYMEFDTGRQGKQVTLVISKMTPSQSGFEDMDTAIEHEKEYQNAAEGGRGRVAGFTARFTALRNQSTTAYVPIGQDDYFTLSYSAPDDLFKIFEPVYKRLLQSFKVAKRPQVGG